MLGIMGNIDQQVNDKADSMQMRGKTSTVSKDLLDVMATQKIAREKDTALKELQMAQQTNPNTIKDQLEQKVMGMTQNEMTNQAGGILAQRAQQKGKPQPPQQGGIAGAMGAPKPPMGGLPAMGGAPRPPMGGAPKPPMGGMPRPPMGGLPAMGGAPRPMMASGGIVGFREGGQPKGRKRDYAEMDRMRRQNEANQKARFSKNEEIRKIRQAFQRGEISAQKMQAEIDAINARVTPAVSAPAPRGGISALEMKDIDAQIAQQEAQKKQGGPQTFTVDQARDYVRDQYNKMAASNTDTDTDTDTDTGGGSSVDSSASVPTTGGETPIGGIGTAAGMAADLSKQSVAPTQAQLQSVDKNMVRDTLKEMAPGAEKAIKQDSAIDLDKARTDAVTSQDKRYNPAGSGEGSIGGLKGLQDKVLAEKQRQAGMGDAGKDFRRRQRLENFKATAGRRGRASRDQFNREASATLGAKQTAVKQYQDRYKKRFEALKQSDAQANIIVNEQLERRNNMINAAVDMSAAEIQSYGQQIENIIAENKGAIDAKMQALGILSQAEMTAAADRQTSYQFFTDQLQKIQQAEDDLYDMLIKASGAMFENLDPDDPQKIEGMRRLREASSAAYVGVSDIALEAIAKAMGKNVSDVRSAYRASRGNTGALSDILNQQANVGNVSSNSAQFLQ